MSKQQFYEYKVNLLASGYCKEIVKNVPSVIINSVEKSYKVDTYLTVLKKIARTTGRFMITFECEVYQQDEVNPVLQVHTYKVVHIVNQNPNMKIVTGSNAPYTETQISDSAITIGCKGKMKDAIQFQALDKSDKVVLESHPYSMSREGCDELIAALPFLTEEDVSASFNYHLKKITKNVHPDKVKAYFTLPVHISLYCDDIITVMD